MDTHIKRPRVLVKAAKIGLQYYNRDKGLKRLLRISHLPQPDRALEKLKDTEHMLNQDRITGSGTYSVERHISVLTALLNEMCLIERKSA